MVTLEEAKDIIERNTFNLDNLEVSINEAGFENEECIEINIFNIDTMQMSEDSYKAFETLCDSFEREVERNIEGLTAYATYDVSGYDYWTNQEQESNYCFVIVCLTDDTTVEDLIKFTELLDNLYDDLINLYDIE